MVFNSLTFIVFLAIVLATYRLPLRWTSKKGILLSASYLFYGAWNPPFACLLALSTVVDWFLANRIAGAQRRSTRRTFLVASLATNLGLLGYFKYGNFLLASFTDVLASLGVVYQAPAMDIVLPVGISFYTFQTLSYTIDVYRGQLKPWPSFLDFALYVSFFPQLVAGPIVRASEFLPQCREPLPPSFRHFAWGMVLMVCGLFEKVILADYLLAPVADQVYVAPGLAGFVDAWTGTLAFSGQIFFDFSGYSTCAIGVAMLFGFVLPDNFRYPYGAIGFSDFWRRWHISLSTWLRDYLYIPLGGNRHGSGRTQANLAITMLLGGLWHGASWRFVVWGALHGAYLVAERALRSRFEGATWTLKGCVQCTLLLGTYALVCLTWVFFRATDFHGAFVLLSAMLMGADGTSTSLRSRLVVLVLTVLMLGSHAWMRGRSREGVWNRMPWWIQSLLLAGMLLALAFAPGDERAFIYFQF